MSFASLSGSSASSSSAISLASQSSALVSEVLEFCELSTASYPLSISKFVNCLRAQSKPSSLLLTCFEVFKDTSPASAVVQATAGIFGHQFNLATVLLPDGRTTHIRADYYAVPPPGANSRLVVSLGDDHDALAAGGHLLSRITAPPTVPSSRAGAPSLAALASLFAVANARLAVRPYSVLGYNCFWMTDMLFYTLARRHAAHWLAGRLTPDAPLRRFLRREAGALETAVACAMPNEAARWWAQLAGNVVRAIQVHATQHERGRYVMHDAEVAEWLREWEKADEAAASK